MLASTLPKYRSIPKFLRRRIRKTVFLVIAPPTAEGPRGCKSLKLYALRTALSNCVNTLTEKRTHARTREAGGGCRVWHLSKMETARYPTHRINPPFEKNQNADIAQQQEGNGLKLNCWRFSVQTGIKTPRCNPSSQGVSKANRGYRRGYKTTFTKIKPSIHAGCSLSLERSHSTMRSDKSR